MKKLFRTKELHIVTQEATEAEEEAQQSAEATQNEETTTVAEESY